MRQMVIRMKLVEKLDAKLEQIGEHPKVKAFHDWMTPKKWFIAGALALFTVQLFFQFIFLVADLFNFFGSVIMYQGGRIMGLTEEQAFRFMRLVFGEQDILDNPYYFTDLVTFITDYVTAIINSMDYIARTAYATAVKMFPMLSDINIEFDWLHIETAKILKTIFSIIQFVIIFVIGLKIKRKIRRKLKLDLDYFDKKFREVTVI